MPGRPGKVSPTSRERTVDGESSSEPVSKSLRLCRVFPFESLLRQNSHMTNANGVRLSRYTGHIVQLQKKRYWGDMARYRAMQSLQVVVAATSIQCKPQLIYTATARQCSSLFNQLGSKLLCFASLQLQQFRTEFRLYLLGQLLPQILNQAYCKQAQVHRTLLASK